MFKIFTAPENNKKTAKLYFATEQVCNTEPSAQYTISGETGEITVTVGGGGTLHVGEPYESFDMVRDCQPALREEEIEVDLGVIEREGMQVGLEEHRRQLLLKEVHRENDRRLLLGLASIVFIAFIVISFIKFIMVLAGGE